MSERRYNDDEVAAIFRTATTDQPLIGQQLQSDGGLTLTDLQTIAREVGISPDAVARAAVAVEVRSHASRRRWFGLPIGVSRTVELNRKISDEEWERLVVQFREVFRARGRTSSDGSLRQWTNGNLHVLLEPTPTGHRLRFGTYNAGARASINVGMISVGISVASTLATAVSGTLGHAAPGMLFLGLAGLGMIASGAVRLPGWARLRERQMEALATDVATPPPSSPG